MPVAFAAGLRSLEGAGRVTDGSPTPRPDRSVFAVRRAPTLPAPGATSAAGGVLRGLDASGAARLRHAAGDLPLVVLLRHPAVDVDPPDPVDERAAVLVVVEADV